MAGANFTAGGTIHCSRVVTTTATAQGVAQVIEATSSAASQRPQGISFEGSRDTPGLTGSDVTIAARALEQVRVYQNGDTCWALVGSIAVTAGSRVKVVSSDGKVGNLGAGDVSGTWSVGIVLKDAGPGELCRVWIDIQQNAVPQS